MRNLKLQPSLMAVLLRACALIVLMAGSSSAVAYDVCSDDYAGKGINSCAHEQMFDEALRFYMELAEDNRFKSEISVYSGDIRAGVGAPDEEDPLYDNAGLLTTITHFWEPDGSFGQPMVWGLDPYPNAFNTSTALWTRALGEYAAGNKSNAYRFLGMIAHFLGDQTVPAHANGDTHPEKLNDGDAFEEYMSNPLLNNTLLTDTEYDGLKAQGLVEFPDLEASDKMLWLFLNVNQVGDYFGSDDYEGDTNLPRDARYPYANDFAKGALDKVILDCNGLCPTTSDQLQDNDKNTYPYFYDDDDDLSLMRTHSYVPGVRKLAALFTLWEQAIQDPIMTLTVHQMEETGFTDAVVCFGATLGLDDCDKPDMYLGIVMGNRRQSPVPPGALLESDNDEHSYRVLDGDRAFPANVTRNDANNSVAEDKVKVTADYHFGQSFTPDPATGDFMPGTDLINLVMQVRDQDVTSALSSPYGDDDIALIHPQGGNQVNLRVDLAKCSTGLNGGVGISYFRLLPVPELYYEEYTCAPSTDDSGFTLLVGGGRGSEEGDFGDDSDDVDVRFSVSMFVADQEPPVIVCAAADGLWHDDDVSIACTATDEGSGLANPDADAEFLLWTNVPAGTETANALTDTREVCDAVGNCATAGPIGGNKVDKKTPEITIAQPTATQYLHSATLVLDYDVTDDGSGVATVTATMNGDTTAGGYSLDSGQAIHLLTALPLGEHIFAVDADDNVGNVSPTESVTFEIIVTTQSIMDAVNQLNESGDVARNMVNPLIAKLRNAKRKMDAGDCTPAQNMYGAFINQLQAQSGKKVSSIAAEILIADAQYLIAHCGVEDAADGATPDEETSVAVGSGGSSSSSSSNPTSSASTATAGNKPASSGGGSMSVAMCLGLLIVMMTARRRRRIHNHPGSRHR